MNKPLDMYHQTIYFICMV